MEGIGLLLRRVGHPRWNLAEGRCCQQQSCEDRKKTVHLLTPVPQMGWMIQPGTYREKDAVEPRVRMGAGVKEMLEGNSVRVGRVYTHSVLISTAARPAGLRKDKGSSCSAKLVSPPSLFFCLASRQPHSRNRFLSRLRLLMAGFISMWL